MSFLSKIEMISAVTYPDNFDVRVGKANQILKKDSAYQKIMVELKINADRHFNSYNKKSDAVVEEGEKNEMDLVKKAEQRQKALGLKKAPNGFWYYAGKL